ncbi:MAG: hypothetical protein FWG65_02630 [Turicibacter sp.]|nr:hypothetical protein [Turicibacter sp.]
MIKNKLLLFVMLLALAACGADEVEEPPIDEEIHVEQQTESQEEPPNPPASPPIIELAAPTPEDIFGSGRTRAEYLEDLDFMYYIIANNFPFIGVIERRIGVDLHEVFAEARLALENVDEMPSDEDFWWFLIANIANPVGGMGHFGFVQDGVGVVTQYGNFGYILDTYALLPWVETFDNPASRAFYNLTDEHFNFSSVLEEDVQWQSPNNVETMILQDGAVAYMRIHSLRGEFMHYDSITIHNFFREVADYAHMIIDIRGNLGGNPNFFPQAVIAPNISEPIQVNYYRLFSTHSHNMAFLEEWGWEEILPIDYDLLERLVYLNVEDLDILDSYVIGEITIFPTEPQPIFSGKFWLLVDGATY